MGDSEGGDGYDEDTEMEYDSHHPDQRKDSSLFGNQGGDDIHIKDGERQNWKGCNDYMEGHVDVNE